MKKTFANLLAITLIVVSCSLLSSCEKSYDDKMYDFYVDDCDGRFNVIEFDLGNNQDAIYYITENYGVWSNESGVYLFKFDYVPRTQRGGQLMINIVTDLSYYRSIVECDDASAGFYYGELVFSGRCKFSDGETVANISPDNLYVNKMSIEPSHTVTLTKKRIPNEEIIPIDVALDDMNYVSDDYFMFLSDQIDVRFVCELANLWIDAATKTGEWNTNSSIIPVRMKLNEKVPYVEIYDISGSSEKLILKSYANVVDDSTIELVSPEGEIFYIAPSTPVTITKTK
ncbi:MAG: hypothetical protein J6A78_03700 [Clostridia bacterium]|nr:hypothetical protein [Clostridia bacterium]